MKYFLILSIPVCIVCSLCMRYVWLYVLQEPDANIVLNYTSGVNAVILSVLIESLAEPVYVFSQSSHFVKLKVILYNNLCYI